jgi:hypothetical protein
MRSCGGADLNCGCPPLQIAHDSGYGVLEVPIWNSAEYGILYRIYFISRNSAEFRGIPYKLVYTEFRTPSDENSTRLNGANI